MLSGHYTLRIHIPDVENEDTWPTPEEGDIITVGLAAIMIYWTNDGIIIIDKRQIQHFVIPVPVRTAT